MAKELSSDQFDAFIKDGDVVVDFWAPWCGPCKQMGPIVDALSKEMEGVAFGKVNVDDAQELAQKHNVMSIPTFLLFQDGEIVGQFSGSMKKEELRERIEKAL